MIEAIAAWFKENQRDLPWRRTYDPYHVWIAEVMLQQTQVETVIPYYRHFLAELPSIDSLASAAEETVLRLWSGLGYYRRARNLMPAARLIVERHESRIPADYDALIALPGIGRYMAGAILSIAFNKPYPAVDGNVRRVLSRINGWTEENQRALWDAAARCVQAVEPRLINQALMELGATVCSFKAPRCLVCPAQAHCVAFRTGRQETIPPVKKRPPVVHVRLFAVIQKRNSRYLMRCSEGLWEFPMFPAPPSGKLRDVGSCRHTITHHRLDVTVCEGVLERQDGYVWKEPEKAPMSSLTKKILRTVTAPDKY